MVQVPCISDQYCKLGLSPSADLFTCSMCRVRYDCNATAFIFEKIFHGACRCLVPACKSIVKFMPHEKFWITRMKMYYKSIRQHQSTSLSLPMAGRWWTEVCERVLQLFDATYGPSDCGRTRYCSQTRTHSVRMGEFPIRKLVSEADNRTKCPVGARMCLCACAFFCR